MDSTKNLLDNLRKQLAQQKTSAQRVDSLSCATEKQMHHFPEKQELSSESDVHDYFFLITGIDQDQCEVIPGSLDGIMAGPNDIVLPKSVLGKHVFLSPDLATTIPMSALGRAFAILDEASYRRVLASCPHSSLVAKSDAKPLPHALPYISEHDDRCAYRERLLAKVKEFQVHKRSILFWRNSEKVMAHTSFNARHALAIAASFLVVGAIVTFSLIEEHNTAAPNTPSGVIACAPSGVLRGKQEPTLIFSPQQTMSTACPNIAIGGDTNKKYTIKITDLDDNLIIEKEISGGSTIPWPSPTALVEDNVYTIELLGGDGEIPKQKFWLQIPVSQSDSNDDPIKGAVAFYHAQYYSEAYLILRAFAEKHPDHAEGRELLEKCLKKLK